jgi:hypothetical protein
LLYNILYKLVQDGTVSFNDLGIKPRLTKFLKLRKSEMDGLE